MKRNKSPRRPKSKPSHQQLTLDMFCKKTNPPKIQKKDKQIKSSEQKVQITKAIQHITITLDESVSVSISQLSAKTVPLPLYNVLFYSNKIQSVPKGDFIDDIHRLWWKNYNLLQSHHGFIQWLFPNEFKSRFNDKAYPIAFEQIQHFLHQPLIYNRYVKTYEMMLQFYGMVLKDKRTGELKRSRNPPFDIRYYKTLLTSYHNHMRITRILSSLCLLGFSRFAKQLGIFLKEEIYGKSGGLQELAKLKIYDREWKEYQNIDCEVLSQSDYFKKYK